MTAVFLDACVLVPVTLTNVILTAAEDGLLEPFWSPEVIEEAVEAIREVHPDIPEERIRHRFAAMDAAFGQASVLGGPASVDICGLPDPDDQHVVAAAVAAGAEIIVTANIRDFSDALMALLGIQVKSPDELSMGCLEADEQAIVATVVKVAAALHDPKRTPEDILIGLELAGAPRFAGQVRHLLNS
ncbi:MAG: PIN domain-containing protein [Bifidobacteriaceae bacterium]|jgi:predicted nucleic acid-binding protein|nr:PIN domain-containing protein [Bifidobacteriaceae bacterium]